MFKEETDYMYVFLQYMLDMEGVSGLIRTAIRQLNVDASTYEVQVIYRLFIFIFLLEKSYVKSVTLNWALCSLQVSIPRQLNQVTQAELTRLLFEEFAVQSVNLTHQSILSLLSYNSKSGIVVDIGERIDITPIMDGMQYYQFDYLFRNSHFSFPHSSKNSF